jgi:precorrin-6A/cobalt-precorrin-6A reductase
MALVNPQPPSPLKVWLVGGTSEAVTLAQALATEGIPCLVTVTTAAAQRAYRESAYLKVRVGAIAVESLPQFIHDNALGAILDASHPFAVEISQGAIAAAQSHQIPYWRYERPGIETVGETRSPLIHRVANLAAGLTPERLDGQRVLITLGYRWLAAFQPWQSRATLFARILPSPEALTAALAAGFTPDRLIALRPPIHDALELALWQQWQITTVITKASGQPGGEATKQAIAQRLGIPLVIIDRPRLNYPVVCSTTAEALAHCRQWWQSKNLSVDF